MTRRRTPADLAEHEIADRWGAARARMKRAEAAIAVLKDEFNRRKLLLAKGERFVVLKRAQEINVLSVADVRAEMGAAWCAEREKVSSRIYYDVVPRQARDEDAA